MPRTSPRTASCSVDHCRWDHLRDVLPSLLFKPSFRNFVLRVFSDNGVAPRPVLYKLHRQPPQGRQEIFLGLLKNGNVLPKSTQG